MGKLFSVFSILLVISISCKNNSTNYQILTTAALKGPSAVAMIYMIEDQPEIVGNFQTGFKIFSEPEQVKALMLEESVDFAILPSTTAAILYNKTGKYLLTAIPVWGTLYLCGSDTSIHSWEDLKGKKLHLMAQGMTPDIMFRYLAEQNGLDPDNDMIIDYSFNGHIELANALSAGIAILGVISEPMVSLIKSRNPAVESLIDFDKEWSKLFGPDVPFAQTALLVKKELAKNHPEVVNDYLEKLKYSIQKVNESPAETAKLLVKYNILPDTETAIMSIPLSNIRYCEAGKDIRGINEYFKVFFNFNPLTIGGKLPDEGFYYKKESL